ncbi:Bug family tripartite tricarboxylate transporter substrate binding protein [Falsiroseomonas sp. HW251]|uniref:Bug family tripartite tricarboxylate transporter substrate binding protein n=1 Tax=Falsiroseomonas sp. HW251 TaxID=3390998 RepID=UPI003D310886
MERPGITRRLGLRAGLGLAPCLVPGLARAAPAQDGRPVSWVVPNGPGSALDIAARLIAPDLGARLGQPVVVENRPGAGGLLAAEAVARAPADGNTLFFGNSSTFAIAPLMIPGHRFDVLRDLAPVGGIGASWNVIAVAADGPHRGLPGLLDAARAAPGRISCATTTGSAQQLAALLFARAAGIELNLLTSTSSVTGLQDVVAGRVDMAVEHLPTVQPLLAERRLRPLAVNAPMRIEQLPDVPALTEYGIAGAEAATWSALYVAARTPPGAVARLAAALRGALAEPRVQETIRRIGASVIAEADGATLTAMLEEDLRRYRAVFDVGGLRP